MIHLFDEAPTDVLARVLSQPSLLAFDFDGTLAPIVADRNSATMSPETHALFTQVCDRYACAIITGRGREDVIARLGSARVWRVVGHHGLETDTMEAERAADVADASRYLRSSLKGIEGIELEDKGLSLAVHFRRSSQPQKALETIHEILAHLPVPMRRVGGKAVVNLVPESAPHKGNAIVALHREAQATSTLYVGDDITDEDVFELRQPSWLITVRVGCSGHSDATYFLHSQSEIDRLLGELLRLSQPAEVR